jgi:hypothetical protein
MAYPTQKEVSDILRSRGLEFERINFFPGTNPNVTAEQIADAIENALNHPEDLREVDLND